MTSSIASRSTAGRLDHTINVTQDIKLPPMYYERSVSKGHPTTRKFKIKEYYTEQNRNLIIPVQQVNSYQEYAAGCSLHDNRCLGHFCITPRGTVLLPQKLVSTLGIMSNQYAKMAEDVFKRDTINQEYDYREKLRALMLGKGGKMRGDMAGGSVDGSMRIVLSLCWEIPPNHLAVPRKVASNMTVLKISKDPDTGLALAYYVEDHVREKESTIINERDTNGKLIAREQVSYEGDYHIGVRPPSLWAGNDQPQKIVLWDRECVGMSPTNAEEYHADHDGDEFQSYNLTEPESIQQCKEWKALSKDKFQQAAMTLPLSESCYQFPQNRRMKSRDQFLNQLGLREKYMVHSTISMRELQDGVKMPAIAKSCRMKEAMADMLAYRLRDPDKIWEDMYTDSIRGIKDIMAQRLNQGDLGDMSRQAKLAASCVKYKGQGKFEIKVSNGTISIYDPALKDVDYDVQYLLGGNPCVRAVSAICQVAQQAALDSHRVSQEVSSNLDLVNNLIKGGSESLVVFNGTINKKCSWKYVRDHQTYAIVNSESIKDIAIKIIAGYNPVVLKEVKIMGGNIKEVCRNGILVVCNYYNIKLSKLELYCLAELLCYKCSDSSSPITTKDGLNDRKMRWMTTIFANHFGLLADMQKRGITRHAITPETITESFAFGNFDYI